MRRSCWPANDGPSPSGGGPSFAGQQLRLTPAGHRVLARQADRVALLGIDRWLGGTHLTPAATWRWDPATQQLTGALRD